MSMKAAAAALMASAALGAIPEHKITNLPGYGPVKTDQYSGLLKVDDPQGDLYYHYWFVGSTSSTPATDPLVLWLNGGPGASSVGYGLLTELGPFHLDQASLDNTTHGIPTVHDNPNAYNKAANVLYLEHPPTVGFSYCGANGKTPCKWDDYTQANASYNFLTKFFQSYPEYKENEFFVNGESYGGMYAPTLVEQIHNRGNVNLKGFLIGNGVIGHQDEYPGKAGDAVKFLHEKVFITEQMWQDILKACGTEFKKPLSQTCEKLIQDAQTVAGNFYIYNVYDTCGNDQVDTDKAWLETFTEVAARVAATGRLEKPSLGQPDTYPCGAQKAAAAWLNHDSVRKALHVPSEAFFGHPFHLESQVLQYNGNRPHLLDIYPTIAGAYRGLIYNGDFDGCVPYTGAEGWISSLGWDVEEAWRPWTFGGMTAGYTQSYKHNGFRFATVKGAGHMVPQYKAREAYHMFSAFINDKPL
eukprot:Rhum_TRINITY_DN16719_c0_g1::Rhum_TRINITY_DN16719_c0_g1_i1::g.164193::m.164193/K16296/SCPL-I; serine carboxypeptidase-like clade I